MPPLSLSSSSHTQSFPPPAVLKFAKSLADVVALLLPVSPGTLTHYVYWVTLSMQRAGADLMRMQRRRRPSLSLLSTTVRGYT